MSGSISKRPPFIVTLVLLGQVEGKLRALAKARVSAIRALLRYMATKTAQTDQYAERHQKQKFPWKTYIVG